MVVLRNFRETIDNQSVSLEKVFATGTSAIRNAGNKEEFIQRVLDETGIKIHVISAFIRSTIEVAEITLQFYRQNEWNNFWQNSEIIFFENRSEIRSTKTTTKIVQKISQKIFYNKSFVFTELKVSNKNIIEVNIFYILELKKKTPNRKFIKRAVFL